MKGWGVIAAVALVFIVVAWGINRVDEGQPIEECIANGVLCQDAQRLLIEAIEAECGEVAPDADPLKLTRADTDACIDARAALADVELAWRIGGLHR